MTWAISSTSTTSDSVDPGNRAAFNYTAYYRLLCSEGYRGNLCAQCDDGYGSTASGECIVCPNKILNTLYFFLSYLLNVFVVVLTVKSQTANLPGMTEQGDRRVSGQRPDIPMLMLKGQVGSLIGASACCIRTCGTC